MRRFGVGAGSVLLLVVMSWPAFHPSEIDSLPVSNYPMFAHPRSRVTSFDVAVVIDRAGVERRLDASEVGGTDQPVQAAMTLRQAIGAKRADVLCAEIAAGLEQDGTVRIVSERYDTVAWFRGEHDAIDRKVHAECPTSSTK
jgi:hypothetical protein